MSTMPRWRMALTSRASASLLGVAGEVPLQDLDGHALADHRLDAAVDDAHAAGAQALLQLVLAQLHAQERIAAERRLDALERYRGLGLGVGHVSTFFSAWLSSPETIRVF